MHLALPPEIVVYDTEYTTWDGARERKWAGPNEHREIVHIGAVKIETNTFRELDSFEVYVRPNINPELSDFFVELTGISQEVVDRKGVDFLDAWQRFNIWRGGLDAYAFGNDAEVLSENCHLSDIPSTYTGRLLNICEVFERYGIATTAYHSSTIVGAFGHTPRQGAHNALNDARSIVDGLRLLDASLHV